MPLQFIHYACCFLCHFQFCFDISLVSPVPMGAGWFIMTFSITEFNGSTSPVRLALIMCFIGVSKDALASTDDLSLTTPYLVTPLTEPRWHMVSATSLIC